MTQYKEFQVGWIVIWATVFMTGLITFLFAFGIGTRPIGMWSYLLVTGIMALMVALMYGMYTQIGDGKITIRFGIGIFRRTIPLQEITEVSIVRNPWYYGLGIRMMPGGWLYNMSGVEAVELKLRNARIVRIGSREPNQLAETINTLLRK